MLRILKPPRSVDLKFTIRLDKGKETEHEEVAEYTLAKGDSVNFYEGTTEETKGEWVMTVTRLR